MAVPSSMDCRLQALEQIEGEIATVLQAAASVLQELAKDKPSAKQVENHSTQFLKQLNGVETDLTQQITYLTQVSTGQPHEGSSYAASKVLQMALHRLGHARSETGKLKLNASWQRGAPQVAPPGAGQVAPPAQGPPPPYQAPAGPQGQQQGPLTTPTGYGPGQTPGQ